MAKIFNINTVPAFVVIEIYDCEFGSNILLKPKSIII